jgi:hypothetical protein
MPDDLDKVLTRAVELIKPPANSVKAFWGQLAKCIKAARHIYQATANIPPPGEMKARADVYLKVLRAAREAGNAVSAFHTRTDDFLDALDQEINRVDALTCLVVPPGARQRDLVADIAARMARDLIDPDPYRQPENHSLYGPFLECPWRRRATLTIGRPWLKLAALIYEGATGEPRESEDMLKACREVDRQQPRYVAKLHFQPTVGRHLKNGA